MPSDILNMAVQKLCKCIGRICLTERFPSTSPMLTTSLATIASTSELTPGKKKGWDDWGVIGVVVAQWSRFPLPQGTWDILRAQFANVVMCFGWSSRHTGAKTSKSIGRCVKLQPPFVYFVASGIGQNNRWNVMKQVRHRWHTETAIAVTAAIARWRLSCLLWGGKGCDF